MTLDEAARCIMAGRGVTVAGDESALRKLPKGLWIGGTIPYFMSEEGGLCTRDMVFVNELPLASGAPGLCTYNVQSISEICLDAPDNGFTVLIVPGFSEIHQRFAHDAPEFDGMYLQPLVGWIAGAHLDDLATLRPKVVFGPTGEFHENQAVAMHVALDASHSASIEIVNLFSPGKGPAIRFTESGFSARTALVNGETVNLAEFLTRAGVDTRMPLVADYCGAMINVSFQKVDIDAGEVLFYAPVFSELEYHLAAPMQATAEAFRGQLTSGDGEIAFCCNCILNYLYGGLEGARTDPMHGPMTFGEIAYQLVNQTMVYLRIT